MVISITEFYLKIPKSKNQKIVKNEEEKNLVVKIVKTPKM